MTLHRRVQIAGFAPETDWSATQTAPNYTDVEGLVKMDGPGTLIWWGVGMNGNTTSARPVTGAGATFDAQFVQRVPVAGGAGASYIGYTPISVTLSGALPYGSVAIERDLPPGATGWLRLIALTAAGPATHLWLNFEFIRNGGVGV